MQANRLVWLLVAFVLWAAMPLAAQERFGGLAGSVTDQQQGAARTSGRCMRKTRGRSGI
jgi:hypothetical protein